jgi:hypothetical protein
MRARVAFLAAALGAALAVVVAALGGGTAGAVLSGPLPTEPPRLAFVTGNNTPQVWIANADGTGRKRLGAGSEPVLSPDGAAVAASLFASKGNALVIYKPGSPTHRYFDVRKVTATPVSWSPTSRYVAVELSSTNNGNGAGLAIVDTQTNTAKTIAGGSICGASFAPDAPERLVYARGSARSFCFQPNVDLYTVAADGTGLKKLTHDGHSLNPVWGAGNIAFDRMRPRHNDAPVFQIWLIHPDGTHRTQLTHTQVPKLVSGLVPQHFSADGERLLAEFVGQDTSETWTIQVSTRKARHLSIHHLDVTPGGLSLDGSTVLVDFGGFANPPNAGAIETLPFAGGSGTVLVKHAAQPSWNK